MEEALNLSSDRLLYDDDLRKNFTTFCVYTNTNNTTLNNDKKALSINYPCKLRNVLYVLSERCYVLTEKISGVSRFEPSVITGVVFPQIGLPL